MLRLMMTALAAALLLSPLGAAAQAPPSYGTPIGHDAAMKALAAAEAEAKKNNLSMVIAILDSGGLLVMLQRLDNTQWGSIEVAKDKAYSAVAFRRPTKAFSDAIVQGGAGLRLLNLTGASLIEGGVPIVVDGKVIGSIGVSGGSAQQDAQVAQAGADAVK